MKALRRNPSWRSLLLWRAPAVEVFAAEEAESGHRVGEGEAFGVVVGVEGDGLQAAGDGDFGVFDAVAKLQNIQFHECGLDLRLPVGIEVVRGRPVLAEMIFVETNFV